LRRSPDETKRETKCVVGPLVRRDEPKRVGRLSRFRQPKRKPGGGCLIRGNSHKRSSWDRTPQPCVNGLAPESRHGLTPGAQFSSPGHSPWRCGRNRRRRSHGFRRWSRRIMSPERYQPSRMTFSVCSGEPAVRLRGAAGGRPHRRGRDQGIHHRAWPSVRPSALRRVPVRDPAIGDEQARSPPAN
jgi:hypothetical protein